MVKTNLQMFVKKIIKNLNAFEFIEESPLLCRNTHVSWVQDYLGLTYALQKHLRTSNLRFVSELKQLVFVTRVSPTLQNVIFLSSIFDLFYSTNI